MGHRADRNETLERGFESGDESKVPLDISKILNKI